VLWQYQIDLLELRLQSCPKELQFMIRNKNKRNRGKKKKGEGRTMIMV